MSLIWAPLLQLADTLMRAKQVFLGTKTLIFYFQQRVVCCTALSSPCCIVFWKFPSSCWSHHHSHWFFTYNAVHDAKLIWKKGEKKATDSRWTDATVQDVQTLLFTFKSRNACPQRRPICLVFLFMNLWPEISSSIWTFTLRHKKAGFWGLSEHTPHRGGNWQELKLCCYDEMTGFVGFL